MTMMRIIICTHFTYNYNNGNWLNLWFTEGCNTTRTCYIYVALYKNNFTFLSITSVELPQTDLKTANAALRIHLCLIWYRVKCQLFLMSLISNGHSEQSIVTSTANHWDA